MKDQRACSIELESSKVEFLEQIAAFTATRRSPSVKARGVSSPRWPA